MRSISVRNWLVSILTFRDTDADADIVNLYARAGNLDLGTIEGYLCIKLSAAGR